MLISVASQNDALLAHPSAFCVSHDIWCEPQRMLDADNRKVRSCGRRQSRMPLIWLRRRMISLLRYAFFSTSLQNQRFITLQLAGKPHVHGCYLRESSISAEWQATYASSDCLLYLRSWPGQQLLMLRSAAGIKRRWSGCRRPTNRSARSSGRCRTGSRPCTSALPPTTRCTLPYIFCPFLMQSSLENANRSLYR